MANRHATGYLSRYVVWTMVLEMGTWRLAGVLVLVGMATLLVARPPAISSPTPVQDSCVACHTSKAALEPLVRPFPPQPAEGEG